MYNLASGGNRTTFFIVLLAWYGVGVGVGVGYSRSSSNEHYLHATLTRSSFALANYLHILTRSSLALAIYLHATLTRSSLALANRRFKKQGSYLVTDGAKAYPSSKTSQLKHEKVNHAAGEIVRRDEDQSQL